MVNALYFICRDKFIEFKEFLLNQIPQTYQII